MLESAAIDSRSNVRTTSQAPVSLFGWSFAIAGGLLLWAAIFWVLSLI